MLVKAPVMHSDVAVPYGNCNDAVKEGQDADYGVSNGEGGSEGAGAAGGDGGSAGTGGWKDDDNDGADGARGGASDSAGDGASNGGNAGDTGGATTVKPHRRWRTRHREWRRRHCGADSRGGDGGGAEDGNDGDTSGISLIVARALMVVTAAVAEVAMAAPRAMEMASGWRYKNGL